MFIEICCNASFTVG